MIGGVTRHMLPNLPGVPHLHVNRRLDPVYGYGQVFHGRIFTCATRVYGTVFCYRLQFCLHESLILIRSKTCTAPRVSCKRKADPCTFLSIQKMCPHLCKRGFSLFSASFDCSGVLEYAKIRTVLQSISVLEMHIINIKFFCCKISSPIERAHFKRLFHVANILQPLVQRVVALSDG